jgi:hypothetical protein
VKNYRLKWSIDPEKSHSEADYETPTQKSVVEQGLWISDYESREAAALQLARGASPRV